MRLALLADSYLLDSTSGVNGTQVQMYNLADAFRRRGHEVHYVAATRDRGAVGPLLDGVTFHWIERPVTVFSWLRDLRAYRARLDAVDPDAVYQRGRSHLTWIAAAWAEETGRPFVWGSNGEDSCTHWRNLRRLRSSPRPAWKKALLYPVSAWKDHLIHAGIRRAHRVVTQTRYQSESLRDNFGKEGLTLPSTFAPAERARAKRRVVLWLANLRHAKQPELFVELAARCEDLPEWRFHLGGGTGVDAYRRWLEARAAPVGNLALLGPVPFERTAEHYARASLFVNTSRLEADGLPNAFIQAWLHGTPVLSLHHDPNGWIEEHGLGACAGGDWERFVAEARRLLREPAPEARQEACRRFARATFAAQETIDAYLDLFARR